MRAGARVQEGGERDERDGGVCEPAEGGKGREEVEDDQEEGDPCGGGTAGAVGGSGGVVKTYFGLKRFEPVTIPGGT